MSGTRVSLSERLARQEEKERLLQSQKHKTAYNIIRAGRAERLAAIDRLALLPAPDQARILQLLNSVIDDPRLLRRCEKVAGLEEPGQTSLPAAAE